jgi:hypothetical protein
MGLLELLKPIPVIEFRPCETPKEFKQILIELHAGWRNHVQRTRPWELGPEIQTILLNINKRIMEKNSKHNPKVEVTKEDLQPIVSPSQEEKQVGNTNEDLNAANDPRTRDPRSRDDKNAHTSRKM